MFFFRNINSFFFKYNIDLKKGKEFIQGAQFNILFKEATKVPVYGIFKPIQKQKTKKKVI
jgi:hypothetical protein